MQLRLERITSPLSELLIVTDEEGTLRALEFANLESRLSRLLREHYREYTLKESTVPASIKRSIQSYFDGDVRAVDDIPTATGGTSFQKQVWKGLRAIPAGTTTTYGQLATTLGRSGSARAVGAANGSNPIPIVVPCHRVIGANGTLTGFASGLPRKRWLLDHESRFAKTSLFAAGDLTREPAGGARRRATASAACG